MVDYEQLLLKNRLPVTRPVTGSSRLPADEAR